MQPRSDSSDSRVSGSIPKGFLYFTAAWNGAAILIVEILGAKMLAPYLGTSHFVWTALISVTLLSLAIGYYLGGRWVDRTQNLDRLYLGMLIAAAYLAISVPLTSRVCIALMGLGLRWSSFSAAAFLFFVPLTLLATTGPFLLRILASSIQTVGNQAGRISAISTLGSVLGAASIGYVLIPHLPNSYTMLITAGVLALLSLIYGFRWKSGSKAASVPMILLLLGVQIAGSAWSWKQIQRTDFGAYEQLERANSNFGNLQIMKRKGDGALYYMNDFLTQNIYDPSTKQSMATFTYMLHGLAHAYTEKLESALCIGLGVGIVPNALAHEKVRVEAVEINEAIVPLARKYFDLDTDSFNLHIGDGRQFLLQTTQRYDSVILDAFLGDSSPTHLMTREAFDSMRSVLNPNGVLVINSFGYTEFGKDYFIASLNKTLKSVFRHVRIHASGNGNVFFVATNRDQLYYNPPANLDHVHAGVRPEVELAYLGIVETHPKSGIVLTDDFNPVDFYDASNREQFRKAMATHYGME